VWSILDGAWVRHDARWRTATSPPAPPSSPLAEPPPDPRVLTAAERTQVERARSRSTWYRDHEAVDDVRLLLRLLDRLTAAPTPAPDPKEAP
jgi:hypothetical protein